MLLPHCRFFVNVILIHCYKMYLNLENSKNITRTFPEPDPGPNPDPGPDPEPVDSKF